MFALILALACLPLALSLGAAVLGRQRESAAPLRVVIRHDPAQGAPFVSIEPEGRLLHLQSGGASVARLSEAGLRRAEFVIQTPDR